MTAVMEAPVAAKPRVDARVEQAELEALGERICSGAGHLAAATGAWLSLIEEFDRRGGWAVHGVKSCAHWLSWKCGIGPGTAREHVRVARALAEFELIRAELLAGRLSYSKVRALTRVVTPATEEFLVELAGQTTGAQLEDLVAGFGKVQSLDDVNSRHEARSFTTSTAEDGSLLFRGRLAPEEGALLLAALAAARDSLAPPPASDVPAGTSDEPGTASEVHAKRTLAQANADALVVLAETVIACGPKPAPGGDRYQVSLHVDLNELLEQEGRRTHGHACLEDGPQLHLETVRRIMCDSAAQIVAHHRAGKPGTSMDVGRRTRVIPRHLRRALVLRDRGCRFPGCTQRRFVDAHHIIHWLLGGPTNLDNLILLCEQHHHYLHERGFGLDTDRRGTFTFRRPDGSVLSEVPVAPGGDPAAIEHLHDATITPTTAVPDWRGDKLQLSYTVDLLIAEEERGRARLN